MTSLVGRVISTTKGRKSKESSRTTRAQRLEQPLSTAWGGASLRSMFARLGSLRSSASPEYVNPMRNRTLRCCSPFPRDPSEMPGARSLGQCASRKRCVLERRASVPCGCRARGRGELRDMDSFAGSETPRRRRVHRRCDIVDETRFYVLAGRDVLARYARRRCLDSTAVASLDDGAFEHRNSLRPCVVLGRGFFGVGGVDVLRTHG